MSSPSNSPPAPAIARHAATIILARETPDGIEVLMTRRHQNMAFMGGLWVFPGGALSAADTSAAALALIPESSQQRCTGMTDIDGTALPLTQCLGLRVAAYRETFEETGVLLAETAEGQHCGRDVLARLDEQRRAIVSQPERFATLLTEEHLRLDVARLVYWAHWITPSLVPKRFDTRFFLAALPPEQNARVDTVEATEQTWMSPVALLDAARAGRMSLSQPTLYNLMELDASVRQHVSLDAVIAAEKQREVVPVLPKVIKDARMIVMPWDEEYAATTGLGVTGDTIFPPRLRALPSRVNSDR